MINIYTCNVGLLSVLVCLVAIGDCAKQPHILLVVADDYGWNDIGYHGSEIPTPNLDALAAAGIKLNNYHVQPVCTPTRASIMTGRYPIRYGLQHNVLFPSLPAGLNLSETLLPEILQQAGYSTHAVGKWHLGYFKWEYTPLYRGFDSYFGYYNGAEDYFTHNRSYDGMSGYDFRFNNSVYTQAIGKYSSTAFSSRVEEIVDNHSATNSSKPLFIYMAFQACHDPLEMPNEQIGNCTNIKDVSRRTYCGMTTTMDRAVGNITSAFQRAGIWRDTIMIFTTDNGGLPNLPGSGNNFPLRGGKFTLWDGGVRGVGFVHGSQLPNPGTTNNQLMHAVDWFPTIANIASAKLNVPNKPTFPLDGFNQWDSITQNKPPPRTQILHNIDPLANTSAIRAGDWKLIQGKQPYSGWIAPPTLQRELVDADNVTIYLFNITADPTEHNNVAASNPDVVFKLQSIIDAYASEMVHPWVPASDPNADPAKHGGAWSPWRD